MTTPHPTCPICGSRIVTWYSLSNWTMQARCQDKTGKCPARELIGTGEYAAEAIDHFIGLTLKVEGRRGIYGS